MLSPTAAEMQGRKSSAEDLTPHYGEDTPAYMVLKRHNLLDTSFRINHVDDLALSLNAIQANSTPLKNTSMQICCWPFMCCFAAFTTPKGSIQLVEDGRGNFLWYGPGVHFICDPWYSVNSKPQPIAENSIRHGDRTLVVVDQGKIGFALDKGKPVLLPPGLHTWQSPTMKFEKSYDLNNNVIRMGPLTLVTVDEGYSAVTEDNGLQKILPGGETYLLTHRNWKFQKYLTEKIQSSDLKRIEATSADNVLMSVDATVIWRISDVATAARNSAETIAKDGKDDKQNLGDIKKLSNDVLKQSEASLAAFIGAVQFGSPPRHIPKHLLPYS